ncbi:DUF1365 domain-containing protein [Streptomyces sp. NPDC002403]
MSPALYECVVAHTRTAPLRYTFRHRTYLWLVDLDQLPRIPWVLRPLAHFDPQDHFGGQEPSIRGGVERFLAARGVDLAGGRVLMLAHARVLGHVFNPLSLYWCYRADGILECVVAEVHNTYGERHCYLLRTGAGGRVEAAKEFYVSPFFPVDGSYRMRLPEPADRLDITVRLERPTDHGDEGGPYVATVRGLRLPASPRALLRSAVRHPWSTAAVSVRIRFHGIRLYLRGLPVQPRRSHPAQKGVR